MFNINVYSKLSIFKKKNHYETFVLKNKIKQLLLHRLKKLEHAIYQKHRYYSPR